MRDYNKPWGAGLALYYKTKQHTKPTHREGDGIITKFKQNIFNICIKVLPTGSKKIDPKLEGAHRSQSFGSKC